MTDQSVLNPDRKASREPKFSGMVDWMSGLIDSGTSPDPGDPVRETANTGVTDLDGLTMKETRCAESGVAAIARFDLGGVGRGGERRTVNINAECDLEADFTELDQFCEDGTVEEFYLSHALEHVPIGRYADFLRGLWRKLKPGGVVRVVQSDIERTLRLWQRGRLSFRAMRTVLFSPANRLRENPFHQHFNMWGVKELTEDFRACGFHPVEVFDAGAWPLDHVDDLHEGAVEPYHGLMIPNLGVAAYKPAGDLLESSTLFVEHSSRPHSRASGGDPGMTDGGIPKIIHQTWKTQDIVAPFRREWQESWCEQNPGWAYRLWTDEDLDTMVAEEFPDFLPVYRSYDEPIKRVDAARYLILKREGGVFVDLDFICLKPIEPLLEKHRLVFGSQHPGTWVDRPDHVCNAFMASAPGHPFWNGIEYDLTVGREAPAVEAGGPNFLSQRANKAFFFLDPPDMPVVMSHQALYPVAWHDEWRKALREADVSELRRLFPQAHAITLWTATWWK